MLLLPMIYVWFLHKCGFGIARIDGGTYGSTNGTKEDSEYQHQHYFTGGYGQEYSYSASSSDICEIDVDEALYLEERMRGSGGNAIHAEESPMPQGKGTNSNARMVNSMVNSSTRIADHAKRRGQLIKQRYSGGGGTPVVSGKVLEGERDREKEREKEKERGGLFADGDEKKYSTPMSGAQQRAGKIIARIWNNLAASGYSSAGGGCSPISGGRGGRRDKSREKSREKSRDNNTSRMPVERVERIERVEKKKSNSSQSTKTTSQTSSHQDVVADVTGAGEGDEVISLKEEGDDDENIQIGSQEGSALVSPNHPHSMTW